jgi:uncharacterized protein YqjF (DUF2071 family)
LRTAPAPVPGGKSRALFLTAEWRWIALLNYEADPAVLAPLAPAGTELDSWRGRTLVSLVGFLFLNTRLFGVPVPFHRCFEEVNLRFYVRRKTAHGWRRGVVFVKELVPRAAVARIANAVYHENYQVVPMAHQIELRDGTVRAVCYRWKFQGEENGLDLVVSGPFETPGEGSEQEFITEHYWGYTRRRGGGALEYRVEHPRWRVCPAQEAVLRCDARRLYGGGLHEALSARPASAFLADGSPVAVYRAVRIAP